MNDPNGEINRHLNFMPQQFSEQQFKLSTMLWGSQPWSLQRIAEQVCS